MMQNEPLSRWFGYFVIHRRGVKAVILFILGEDSCLHLLEDARCEGVCWRRPRYTNRNVDVHTGSSEKHTEFKRYFFPVSQQTFSLFHPPCKYPNLSPQSEVKGSWFPFVGGLSLPFHSDSFYEFGRGSHHIHVNPRAQQVKQFLFFISSSFFIHALIFWEGKILLTTTADLLELG